MSGRIFFLVAIPVIVSACESSTTAPLLSKLTCEGAGGTVTECALNLQAAGGFSVTLESSSCHATENRVRLTQPAANAQILTSNGCNEPIPTVWMFAGPFSAGTSIALEVESQRLLNDPELRVTGDYPEWLIEFEDGGDTDFNDLVLRVRALPT